MNDGGPAFPMTESGVAKFNPGHPDPLQPDEIARMMRGMTLRDWFAGQALAGIYSNYTPGKKMFRKRGWWIKAIRHEVVCAAFSIADMMVAESDKEQG